MKSGLWTTLGVVFGVATFVAIINGIHDATAANAGPESNFGVTTGVGDAILQIAFIAVLGLITRRCWKKAAVARGPREREESTQPRRPWER